MTLASRLSTAVSVLAGGSGAHRDSGTTEPDQAKVTAGLSQLLRSARWVRAGKAQGDPGLVVLPLVRGSLLSVFPGSVSGGPSHPWTLAPPLLRSPPRDCLCSFARGSITLVPLSAQPGPSLDLQPCSAAGPEQSQAFPASSPPAPPLSPTAACSSVRESRGRGAACSPHLPQPLDQPSWFGD